MPASTLCLRSFPPPALARSRADMRKDVQDIFKATPHEKQVMMFSATLNTEMRTVCKKFMQVAAPASAAPACATPSIPSPPNRPTRPR